MLAIADSRAPHGCLEELAKEFSLHPFSAGQLTYPQVSGHPDIFMFQSNEKIICASNTPIELLAALRANGAEPLISAQGAGWDLVSSTRFNVCAADSYWVHKPGCAAPELAAALQAMRFIAAPQAYARCTSIAIGSAAIATSDMGVGKAAAAAGLDVFYASPHGISLPGYRYGFFGGTCGILGRTIYFLGSIYRHSWGHSFRQWAAGKGFGVKCLGSGPLYDGGGIFFA
jgi:hypothetical protein